MSIKTCDIVVIGGGGSGLVAGARAATLGRSVIVLEKDKKTLGGGMNMASTMRTFGSKWQKASKEYLRVHPLCVKCLEENIITPATVVDHIVPHRGDKKLFWDQDNWQPLCKACHDKKTGSGL